VRMRFAYVAAYVALRVKTGLPNWSKQTLQQHVSDTREHLYTAEQLERGETADILW
jgi:hypothetical protein